MKNLKNLQKKFETDYPANFKPFSNTKNISNLTSNNKQINILKNNQNDNTKKNLFLQNSNFKLNNNIFKGRSYTFDTNKQILNSKTNNITINNDNNNLNKKPIPIKVNLGNNKEIKIKIINNNENVIKKSCYQGLQRNILPKISLSNFHKNENNESNKLINFNKTSENIKGLTFNSLRVFKNKNNNFMKYNTPNKRLLNINKLKISDKNFLNKTCRIKINLNKLNNINNNENIALNRTNPKFFKNNQIKINEKLSARDNYNTEEYKNNNEKDEDNRSNNSDKEADPRIDFDKINRLNRSRPQTSYGGLNARKKNLRNALQNDNNIYNKK